MFEEPKSRWADQPEWCTMNTQGITYGSLANRCGRMEPSSPRAWCAVTSQSEDLRPAECRQESDWRVSSVKAKRVWSCRKGCVYKGEISIAQRQVWRERQ